MGKFKNLKQWPFVQCLWALAKWLFLAIILGALVGSIGALFGHTLIWANKFREAYPYVVYGLPVGGLVIVLLYRGAKNTEDRGTNTVIGALQEGSDVPFKMAPLIFISTTITQLVGGSAGREGAALQLGGSVANRVAKLFRFKESSRKMLIMCGMSAGFSALFGTPLAASVFSLEIACVGYMQLSGFVPCVIAAYTGFFMAKLFGMPPEVFPVEAIPGVTPVLLLQVVALAVVAGVVSILFCKVLHGAEHLYGHCIKNSYLRIAVAGILLILLTGAADQL